MSRRGIRCAKCGGRVRWIAGAGTLDDDKALFRAGISTGAIGVHSGPYGRPTGWTHLQCKYPTQSEGEGTDVITTILRTAPSWLITSAQGYTANCLRVPCDTVPRDLAVAYVVRHFQGDHEGWEGFAEMLEAAR